MKTLSLNSRPIAIGSLFFIFFILSLIEGFSQNIGIGTTTPTGKLQVNHRSTFSNPSLMIFDSSSSSAGRIKFRNAGGNRFWQFSSYVNNANAGGQFMDMETDSLLVMTLRGNGNVGINNFSPAEKLDVNGNINLTGMLKVNGNAGTAGQVLTSDGTGSVQWKNAPYSNNSRFASQFTLVEGTDDITYNTFYNLNPADVTSSGSTITINKAGLWHFEGYVYLRITWSPTPIRHSISVRIIANDLAYFMIRDGSLDRDPLVPSETYVKTLHFSHNIYMSAPSTIRIFRSFFTEGNPTVLSKFTQGVISGYLISE